MIKIITPGRVVFSPHKCSHCGCVFEFDPEDTSRGLCYDTVPTRVEIRCVCPSCFATVAVGVLL